MKSMLLLLQKGRDAVCAAPLLCASGALGKVLDGCLYGAGRHVHVAKCPEAFCFSLGEEFLCL